MRGKAEVRLLDEHFPGWTMENCNGTCYVQFKDLGREHKVKLQQNSWGRFVKYMGDTYYLK